MGRYFDRFPLVNYDGVPAKNLLSKVDFTQEAMRDIYSNFDYVLEPGMNRPDMVSYSYYDSSQYDWLIYLANGMIDPYHDFYMSTEDFQAFIIGKYGSLEIARNTTLFYRNDWASDESIISPEIYESLEAPIRKYWKPIMDSSFKIAGYDRVKEDWIIATNKIISLKLTDASVLVGADIVYQTSTDTYASIMSIDLDTNIVQVQHVSGMFEADGTDTIEEVVVLQQTISDAEAAFWSPVSAYEYEEEKNELKRYVNIIKRTYLPDVERLFIEKIEE
jgi:hypothetical protein